MFMLRGLVRKKLMNNIQSMRGHCEAPPEQNEQADYRAEILNQANQTNQTNQTNQANQTMTIPLSKTVPQNIIIGTK